MRFIAVFLCFFLTGSVLWGQQAGDYRSIGSGSWTNVSLWEVYNGSAWVAATTYPGEVAGTNDVSVEGGHTIVLNGDIPNDINALLVGDGSGATDAFQVNGNAILNTPLIELLPGGFAEWTNNVSLYLPAGALFRISGGVLDDGKPCNAAKRLVIGSQIYSTCNGGAGVDYSFEDLNNSGGSLAVAPSSNSPLCQGQSLTLFANPSGAGSDTASFSWSGSGPGGYSFNSTDENPVITGLNAGFYTYTVSIQDLSGYTFTASTEVEINSGVTINTQPGSQQAVVGGSALFTVSATGVATYRWQVSTDGGSSFTNLSDGPGISGSATDHLTLSGLQLDQDQNRYRAALTPSDPGCTSSETSPASLSVFVPTAITNRKITFRVNN